MELPGAHAAHCQDIRVMVRAFTFRGFPIVDGELFAPHPDLVNHGGTWKMSQIPDPWPPWPMVRLSYAKLFSGWSFPGWLRATVSAGPTEVQSPLIWSLPASMKNHESF